MLTIEPQDPVECARLLEAIKVKPERVLTIRCSKGCKLARVGSGPAGIVFVGQPWTIPNTLPSQLDVDGQTVSRRETIGEHYTDENTGERIDFTEKHSTLAFLGRAAGHVDLLVNCDHGSAVLDQTEVLEWVRAGKAPKIPTGAPSERPRYVTPEPAGEKRTTTVTRTIKGTPMPLDEMRKWLGWD
jgi:hypothetical protein